MLTYTLGFRDPIDLQHHFWKHGAEFGITTADEYEALADVFLGGPRPASVLECQRRKDADILRFDDQTSFFGAIRVTRVIRTLYKPIPCASLPVGARARMVRERRCHREASNLLYFRLECAKR